MKQQNQQRIQHCSHHHVHSTYTYSVTKICCCLCSLSVTPQIDKSNQLCLCKYNKECGVESVIYSAIWFRSNLFYSAFFGRISVNFFGIPVPDIPWFSLSVYRATRLYLTRRPCASPDMIRIVIPTFYRISFSSFLYILHGSQKSRESLLDNTDYGLKCSSLTRQHKKIYCMHTFYFGCLLFYLRYLHLLLVNY